MTPETLQIAMAAMIAAHRTTVLEARIAQQDAIIAKLAETITNLAEVLASAITNGEQDVVRFDWPIREGGAVV